MPVIREETSPATAMKTVGAAPVNLILELASFLNAGTVLVHHSALSSNMDDDNLVQASAAFVGASAYFQAVGDEELAMLCPSESRAKLVVIEIEPFLSIR